MRLSNNDYISILKYYDIDASNMKPKDIKQNAENILAEKLCRCIKKVNNSDKVEKTEESKAIAICKNSIFSKKNLKISKFKCKGSAKLLSRQKQINIKSVSKNNKHKRNDINTLTKTKKNLHLREKH
jgi:hypothetical protein